MTKKFSNTVRFGLHVHLEGAVGVIGVELLPIIRRLTFLYSFSRSPSSLLFDVGQTAPAG